MNVALVGRGRMGGAIERQASLRGHNVVARLGSGDSGIEGLGAVDVAFEFTVPGAAETNVRALLDSGVSVVCGTTGWTPGSDLDDLARRRGVGLVIAPNFSLGVQLYYRVVQRAAEVFGAAGLHDPFVSEAHHRGKRDSPSGTARRLGEILLENDSRLRRVHEGNPQGVLPPEVLPIVSLRAGAEPGTHEVGFDGLHDRVTLRHAARGREGFALGAVMAGEWILGRQGRFSFEELVDRYLEGGGHSVSGGQE